LEEHCKQKVASVQGNNITIARDVLFTMERIVKELNNLCVRTGTYMTLFVVHRHVNDTIQSSMHGTNNSEDFWEDQCQQHKFMCLTLFTVLVTSKKDIAMNYKNYKTAVSETYAVQLIGWPSSIDFISPSNIRIIDEIRKLCDALKARTCYWALLTPAKIKAHTAELDTHHSAGEVVQQPHKK
ncbi:uncharacterized protein BJ212DRAFT_1215182, partial [Suillus subaureus]